MKGGLYSQSEIETLEPQETYYENQERVAKAKERHRRLDRFAAAALTGLLSTDGQTYDRKAAAIDAWAFARAMLDNEPKD